MDQKEKKLIAAKASLDYIQHGSNLGVGTGSTVNELIDLLPSISDRIETIVSSSRATTERLEKLGHPRVRRDQSAMLERRHRLSDARRGPRVAGNRLDVLERDEPHQGVGIDDGVPAESESQEVLLDQRLERLARRNDPRIWRRRVHTGRKMDR